jgi:hypothetical protein
MSLGDLVGILQDGHSALLPYITLGSFLTGLGVDLFSLDMGKKSMS